tara:strand:- start:1217 stop:2404 length:1188 start_codon:yes stop_codon:yes gene_type:complete
MARKYKDRKYTLTKVVGGKTYTYYTRKGNITGDPENKIMKLIFAQDEDDWNKKLAKAIREYQSGEDKLDGREDKFDAVAKAYLKANEVRRPTTWIRKEQYLRLYILPALKDKKVKNIISNDIRNLYNKVKREKTSGILKETHKVLNDLFKWCIKNNMCIVKNPISEGLAEMVYLEYREWQEQREDANDKEYNIEFLKDILVEVRGTGRAEIIWHLNSISGGLRISEALALQVKDIDLTNNTIDINKTVVQVNQKRTKGTSFEGDYLRTNRPKTKTSKRIVHLIPPTRELVVNAIKQHDLKPNDYLMVNSKGKMMNKDTWNKNYFRPVMNKLGFAYSTHDLRKFFTSYHISTGTPIKVVQQWLGHKHASTTLDSYNKVITEHEDQNKWKTAELVLG